MTTDYNNTDRPSLTTRKLTGHKIIEDTVHFRSDNHTHQHTHCQHFFYKHHTDGRQAQHTKGHDVWQLQALTRPYSMQKSHKEPT